MSQLKAVLSKHHEWILSALQIAAFLVTEGF